ncbi:MAG: GNAT family N-acetyltransferase [Bacteroidales bacterium]|nr:GNAT family N-acetyltransferase [Bacteroidales bacterium]
MIVRKGNIVFRKITVDDIELVRNWRNSHHVKQYMAYRETITPEMQLKWFHSINNVNNLYFIFEYKGEKIGVFNAKDIDWEKGSMETGIFIAVEKYIHTELPLLAVLSFGDVGLRLFQMDILAHILKSNTRALRYNKLLGFELCPDQEAFENQLYKLNKEKFFNRTKLLRPALYKLMGVKDTVLHFNHEDIESGLKDFLISRIDKTFISDTVPDETGLTIKFIAI